MTTRKPSRKKAKSTRNPRPELVPARVGISVTPGEMLRTIRELQELTQAELATMTGMAQSNLSALETGARELGRERAVVLARALRVHPAVLLFPDFDVSEVA
ncbi:MAG: XRE family transcriptional regulator [Myxococcales bacterium]|nr:MAG: XRE family transcriptional regulator [Myxococcales bacterium]